MKRFACWTNPSPRLRHASAPPMIPRLRAVGMLSLCWVFLATFISAPTSLRAAEDSSVIHWTEVPGAQVKIGGKVPIMWNLYQPDKKEKKKDNLVLVLLGRRYVLLDTKGRLAYEVKLSALHAMGKDFTSDDLTATSRMIPTSDWSVRDVGPSEMVGLTFGDYGGVLEVQVPHPLILTPPLHYY